MKRTLAVSASAATPFASNSGGIVVMSNRVAQAGGVALRTIGGALASAAKAALQRRRVTQVLAFNAIRRAEFRWWQAALILYVALLWRSSTKGSTNLKGLSFRKLIVAVHVGLIKYLANKASSGAFLLQSVKAAPQYAADAFQDLIKARVEEFLDTQMDTLGEKTKTILKDPYMPIAVQGTVEDFVDVILPDLKLALFNKTEEMIGSYGYRQAEIRRIQAAKAAKAQQRLRGLASKRARRRSRSASKGSAWPNTNSPHSAGSRIFSLRGQASAEHTGEEGDQGSNLEDDDDDEMDSLLDALQDEDGDLDASYIDDSDDDYSDSSSDEEALFHFRDLSIGTPKRTGLLRKRLITGALTNGNDTPVEARVRFVSDEEPGQSRLRHWASSLANSRNSTCAKLRRRYNRALLSLSEMRLYMRPSYLRGAVRFHYLGLRAKILYNSSPYDRSFWRSIRNPTYWLMQGIGLIPGIGMVWWLFLFLLHDKRDEYQLSQFLVGFQTAKFFSQGCFNLLRGALLFYMCATRAEPRCDTHGPRVGRTLDVVFFLIQIVVVWLTFFMLPDTEPCRAVNDPKHAFLLDENRQDRNQAALRTKVRLGRGGRLAGLFWWDTFFVVLVLFLFALAFFGFGQRDWQLRTTCYFLNVLYGLAALPFVPFKIPVVGQLLTPTKATGYTRDGETVIRVVAAPPQAVLHFQNRELKQRQYARRRLSAAIISPRAGSQHDSATLLRAAANADDLSTAASAIGSTHASGTTRINLSRRFPFSKASNGSGRGLATVPEDGPDIESASSSERAPPAASADSYTLNPYKKQGFFLKDSFESEAFRLELLDEEGYESDEESSHLFSQPSSRFQRRVSEVARETAMSTSLSSARALLERRASNADILHA